MANPLESCRVEPPPREGPFHRPERLARGLAVPSLLHDRVPLRKGSRRAHLARWRLSGAAGLLIDAAPRYRRSPCPAVPLEHAYGRSLARLKPVGGHRLPGEETRHERDLGAVT